MKLIIDIPEKVLTAIQNGEDYRYDIHTAIAQGVSYEEKPQGDLISREDLKDFGYINKGNFNTVESIREWIDNAPTVVPEITVEQAVAKIHETGLLAEHNKMLKEWVDIKCAHCNKNVRPQGEWIIKGQDIYCSICDQESAYNEFGASKFSNFCPNCGAKMKGGAE